MAPIFNSGDDREHTLATVLIESLDVHSGAVLVAHDRSGRIERELQSRGCETVSWHRMQDESNTATAWPYEGQFDGACLRLSKDKPAFEMAFHAIVSRVQPGGSIWIYGANDEGIKSVPKRISCLCENLKTIATKRHCRVIACTVGIEPTGIRPNLSDWLQSASLDFAARAVAVSSYPGVFAKGQLDSGTRFLLDTIPARKPHSTVLDYGCGSGVIAMGLATVESTLDLTLIDADAIAIEAARKNLPQAKSIVGHSMACLGKQQRFDSIVANPPYHDGKERCERVVRALITHASHRLNEYGELWLVLQKQVKVRPLLNQYFAVVEHKSKGAYIVWKAHHPHPNKT